MYIFSETELKLLAFQTQCFCFPCKTCTVLCSLLICLFNSLIEEQWHRFQAEPLGFKQEMLAKKRVLAKKARFNGLVQSM